MALKKTINDVKGLLQDLQIDLEKAENGNKAAAQRVRTGTVRLEKIAKQYRKESITDEKKSTGRKPARKAASKKKPAAKKKAAPKKKATAKKPATRKAAPKKATTRKAAPKKATTRKAAPKRTTAKRTTAKKTTARKPAAKKSKATAGSRSFAMRRSTAKIPSRRARF